LTAAVRADQRVLGTLVGGAPDRKQPARKRAVRSADCLTEKRPETRPEPPKISSKIFQRLTNKIGLDRFDGCAGRRNGRSA
jgi:hypothetical protein